MKFRQVHLDFHTGEHINEIGSRFDKSSFQEALKIGHVNSINIFAKCHHGFLYYLDGVTPSHPGLSFNLLDEILEACYEIGVDTQIYISAGLDEVAAKNHPEWLFRHKDQSTTWVKDFFTPGYHELCMNTGYLQRLLLQVKEVITKYETKGIWLDIVGPRKCYCQTCMNQLLDEGKDPNDASAVVELGERTYQKYLNAVEAVVKQFNPDMQIFHNSGHVPVGRYDLNNYNTHYEIESLPTGGWGYDHFPLSARYVQQLGKDFLGMTGKFHTTWGEFGGFKHQNALKYEAALTLAHGGKMCVGDQMHPMGYLEPYTYELIGNAYKEVEAKEPWCEDVEHLADVGLLTVESIATVESEGPQNAAIADGDVGAIRMLQEGHYLYDVIDTTMDFQKYKVIVLPDRIRLSKELSNKLVTYLHNGGQVLATGYSGLDQKEDTFVLDLDVEFIEENKYKPDYFISKSIHDETPFVMYSQGINISHHGNGVLGEREDPYFNRTMYHFCSHYHTPNHPFKRSPGMVKSKSGIYIAWCIFEDYCLKGSYVLKEMFTNALDQLLGNQKTLICHIPSQGVTTIQHQNKLSRYVHHIAYASPIKRGRDVEVIEDLVTLYDVKVSVQLDHVIKKVYLAPSMTTLEFEVLDGCIHYLVPKVHCHEMIVLEY